MNRWFSLPNCLTFYYAAENTTYLQVLLESLEVSVEGKEVLLLPPRRYDLYHYNGQKPSCWILADLIKSDLDKNDVYYYIYDVQAGGETGGYNSNIACLAISTVLLLDKGHSVRPVMTDSRGLSSLPQSADVVIFDFPDLTEKEYLRVVKRFYPNLKPGSKMIIVDYVGKSVTLKEEIYGLLGLAPSRKKWQVRLESLLKGLKLVTFYLSKVDDPFYFMITDCRERKADFTKRWQSWLDKHKILQRIKTPVLDEDDIFETYVEVIDFARLERKARKIGYQTFQTSLLELLQIKGAFIDSYVVANFFLDHNRTESEDRFQQLAMLEMEWIERTMPANLSINAGYFKAFFKYCFGENVKKITEELPRIKKFVFDADYQKERLPYRCLVLTKG